MLKMYVIYVFKYLYLTKYIDIILYNIDENMKILT